MKATEFKKTLEQMDVKQLQDKLDALRQEVFGLKLSVATAHVKDHAQFKQLRKNIARVLTHMKRVKQTGYTK